MSRNTTKQQDAPPSQTPDAKRDTYNPDPKGLLRQGTNRCYCPECGEYFSTVRAFDMHLIGRGTANVRCRPPQAAGLVQGPRGIWQRPGKPPQAGGNR